MLDPLRFAGRPAAQQREALIAMIRDEPVLRRGPAGKTERIKHAATLAAAARHG